MAAPFLLLWRFDPIGPSYMVAIIGVATVFLLYKFLRDIAGLWPAFIASELYSCAPLIVRYSRSSWNPNPLPFFSLLIIYFLYLGFIKKKTAYYFYAGAAFGIAIQLHYLALILVPISVIILLACGELKKIPKIFFFSIIGFLITFSPFLLFEAKHNFPNFRTILEFVTRGSTVGIKTSNIVWSTTNLGNIFLEYITSYTGTIYTKAAFWMLLAGAIAGLVINRKNKGIFNAYIIATIWFFGGLILLKSYKGQLYDYYFGAIFPSPFLLFGLIISLGWKNIIFKITSIAIFIIVIIFFIRHGFYKTEPNRLILQTQTVADFVIDKTENKPFNFALMSDGNSDHAYRYFLEIKNHQPKPLEEIITDQLLVVCESAKCSPLGYPTWEIAGFGRAEIQNEWNLPNYNFKVYKLIHWSGEPSPAGKPAVKGI
jgi:4-amino-4-deoxy-L-arabinose transferase-like glycosyltransferase